MRPPSSEVSLVGVGLQNFVVRYFLVNVDVVFILKSEFSWCKSVRNYKPLCSLMSVENGGTFERYSPKKGGRGDMRAPDMDSALSAPSSPSSFAPLPQSEAGRFE